MRKAPFALFMLACVLLCLSFTPVPERPEPPTPTPEVCCALPLVQPLTPAPVSTPEPEPEPVVTPPLWTDKEVEVLAKMMWGECRGVASVTEQAACVWCALNRCDSFEQTVIEVVTAPAQFAGYAPGNPVDPELAALCEDVLARWYAEKEGQEDVGRVLPPDYLFFHGDGERNHFRNQYRGGDTWGWSLPSPYES